jgi:hypothetical protein
MDATAADYAIERVLAHENRLKKLHLTMLVEIRNTLTADQRKLLEENRRGQVFVRALPGVPAIPSASAPPAQFKLRTPEE